MPRRNFKLVASLVFSANLVAACDYFAADYQDYPDAAGGAVGTQSPECEAAATLFTQSVAPHVDAKCATGSCHAVQPIKGKPLKAGDTTTNRSQLKAYAAGSANTLYDKFSSPSHGGKALNDETGIPLAALNEWMSLEAKCK